MSNQQDEYYLDKLGKVYRFFRSKYMQPQFPLALRLQCEVYIVQYVIRAVNEHMDFLVPNMMWIDPDWVSKIPDNSKVVLYGAGNLGKTYFQQITSNTSKNIEIVGWVDCAYKKLCDYPMMIQNPELIMKLAFDYIILAVMDENTAIQIRDDLIQKYHLTKNKIIWVKQEEALWKYMKSLGLFY